MTSKPNQPPSGAFNANAFNPLDIEAMKKQVVRPSKMVITGGMPYANGPLHLGHLAGAMIPPDVFARYMRMLIGAENVLHVCGTDDHGSTSELAALKAGKPVREFIDGIHVTQAETLRRYSIGVDTYTGTSRPECYPEHVALAQDFIRKLYKNNMLDKRMSRQWFDTEINRFLQDRLVSGKCPNPKCDNDRAYSDECEKCGTHYDPSELLNPISAVTGSVPVLKDTVHWWLDLWKVSEELRTWIQSKTKTWRQSVYNEVINTVLPALSFDNTHEAKYKELKDQLPKHKSKYAAGKKVACTFETKADLNTGRAFLDKHGIPNELLDGWAHRSISRDVAWGIPMPADLDPEMMGKTLYVWPDSLVAPISFSKVALKQSERDPERFVEFWKDPKARICQFLGQDNVYFYVLMQGAMWLGSQSDIHRTPQAGEYQLTDVFSVYHLMVNGEKMSKSTGNYYTGDQLLDEKGYSADQVRYFLAMLSLHEKASNFDLATLDERNRFLAGPMNAAFEKPISACHSKFGGKVPEGKLNDKVLAETAKLVKKYLHSMERAEYPILLNLVENYARQINSLFTQFKPHDDRQPLEQRSDALYSCFYVLKNLMIMLYPFVPSTMDKLRESLKLPRSVFSIDELGTGIQAGHEIGDKQQYFPAVDGVTQET
ncbi:MAG: class I tRNA ligase family protein [Bdellovibrionales bacterium]|nr:class I tRNA ligase family protein [Bdellovibrionales bacterium]